MQKYGGTSVGSVERIQAVAARIGAARASGQALVVVVSAMADTTDDLLTLARRIHPDPPVRELDMLLTAGERISMALVSMALDAQGLDAVSFTGSQSGIITDDRHADAKIHAVKGDRIRDSLAAGRIVIVAGFQGVSPRREITTLGRGGSDTTAVALAAALGAEQCEIYTDVEGVYSADPRIVPHAVRLEALSYDEMLELASHGARVLHPRSVEVARRFHVPLHVRSSFTSASGTVVQDMEPIETGTVRGIACDEDVALLVLSGLPQADAGVHLLGGLGDAGIRTLLVVQSAGLARTEVAWLLQKSDLQRAESVVRSRIGTWDGASCRAEADVAAITAVGHAIHSHPGTTGRILRVLADTGVRLLLVSSAATSLTCLVPRAMARDAVRALHDELGLSRTSPAGAVEG